MFFMTVRPIWRAEARLPARASAYLPTIFLATVEATGMVVPDQVRRKYGREGHAGDD
jgi:hypothetical protein